MTPSNLIHKSNVYKFRMSHKNFQSLNLNIDRLAYRRKTNKTFSKSIALQLLKEHFCDKIDQRKQNGGHQM